MPDEQEDDVSKVLAAIKKHAYQVNDEGEAGTLALYLKYAFHFMERKSFADVPLTGPEVDQAETNDTKVDRHQVSEGVRAMIELGKLTL